MFSIFWEYYFLTFGHMKDVLFISVEHDTLSQAETRCLAYVLSRNQLGQEISEQGRQTEGGGVKGWTDKREGRRTEGGSWFFCRSPDAMRSVPHQSDVPKAQNSASEFVVMRSRVDTHEHKNRSQIFGGKR